MTLKIDKYTNHESRIHIYNFMVLILDLFKLGADFLEKIVLLLLVEWMIFIAFEIEYELFIIYPKVT